MTVDVILDGKIVASSQNLRAIIRYSSKHPIDRVAIHETKDSGAKIAIYWTNGAACLTDFVSFSVCKEWCKRSRTIRRAGNTQAYPYRRFTSPRKEIK